jgi:hypothetical protein
MNEQARVTVHVPDGDVRRLRDAIERAINVLQQWGLVGPDDASYAPPLRAVQAQLDELLCRQQAERGAQHCFYAHDHGGEFRIYEAANDSARFVRAVARVDTYEDAERLLKILNRDCGEHTHDRYCAKPGHY